MIIFKGFFVTLCIKYEPRLADRIYLAQTQKTTSIKH